MSIEPNVTAADLTYELRRRAVAHAAELYAACKALLAENDDLRQMLAERAGITHTIHDGREYGIAAIAKVECA